MGKNNSNGGSKSQYSSAAMKKLINREQQKRQEKKQKQNLDETKKKKGKESKTNNNNIYNSNNIFQSDPPIVIKANNNNNNNNNSSNASGNSKLSDLQLKFAKKLEGARFRTINEKLYTTKGVESFEEFQKDPKLFDIYHEGFREQASHWPENPLHIIISWIKNKHSKEIIADFGCGEALLAKTLVKTNKVYSFDLVARNEFITACDISHTPLEDNSVNIVVFCLGM
jgi:16S rRNA G1207 methylase RsmC